ncbi:MAG: Ig-like domain-containing protein, partial [Candidatus Thiodiazotropha sp.]
YNLVASYSGDDDFLPSSTTEGHTVVKDETTTSILTDEPDPSQVGQPFTVTFEVTASTGTPSGLVTVTVAGEAAICTGTLADGAGACEITLDTPGTHTLTASYSGDADFLPSSATEEHTVLPIKLFLPLVARK